MRLVPYNVSKMLRAPGWLSIGRLHLRRYVLDQIDAELNDHGLEIELARDDTGRLETYTFRIVKKGTGR